MFEQLSDKLNVTFERLRGRPRVTEADLEEALRDVRVALLEAGRRPMLVAADVHRPAAIDQLRTLGKQLDITVNAVDAQRVAADVAKEIAAAPAGGKDTVIVDTAGRLHIDEVMMAEVEGV